MSIYDNKIESLQGQPDLLGGLAGKAALFVNVASKCGLTPQYTALEQIHEQFSGKGFSVVGFPCNQFGAQEPGSTSYGVTFPMSEKIDVNGESKHPLYAALEATADAEGHSGDIRWNFEKFLIGPDGTVAARFSPMTAPDDPAVLEAIEALLPA